VCLRNFGHKLGDTYAFPLPLCKGLNKIKIMSPLLETLSLIDLDDALVVNPNLRWFKIFDSFTFQNTCALDCSKLMEVRIGLKNNRAIISFNDMLPLEIDTTESKVCWCLFWVIQNNFSIQFPFKFDNLHWILFSLSMKEVISHFGNLQSKVEPLCIKNINVEILMSRIPRYESLIDEIFSYFHPQTLLVRVNSDELMYNNFI